MHGSYSSHVTPFTPSMTTNVGEKLFWYNDDPKMCSVPTLNHLCCILKNMLSCMHTCLTFIFLYILNNLMLFMMVMVIILLIPITRFFYLDLKLLFLNVVSMNHLPFPLKNHVSILLMKYVPILEMMVLNHDCAFPSKVSCSKSWFLYINDNEMDNVNKGGQRSSSMLSYG